MRVIVDYDLCEGNARCVKLVPSVFQLDDEDRLHLLIVEPEEKLREAIDTAVATCPRGALSVVET